MGKYLEIARKVTEEEMVSPGPSPWSALADSGRHHNDVQDLDEGLFLIACELIQYPGPGLFPGDPPSTWGHYAPFWRDRLPREAFEEIERRYRQRLADLGLPDDLQTPHGPKPLRPLMLNPEGTGCAECGGAEFWVSIKGVRYCLTCHPAPIREMITIGTIQPAKETSRPSDRRQGKQGSAQGRLA